VAPIQGKVQVTEESPEEEEKKVYKGLGNQGATCYMNSLLQALFMTPDFRKMIYKFKYDPAINPGKKDCIIYQIQKLFASLQTSNHPFATTSELT
jgi:ubiquitin C-terminal hydrolase